ncbi:MAG UNVERIFIED_CONTAM: hypothetical protein LVR29_32735 [Microcystis novacekii LVE1205-3]|jgi:hypothetical protein
MILDDQTARAYAEGDVVDLEDEEMAFLSSRRQAVASVANPSATAGQKSMRKGRRTISRRITKKNNHLDS